jgi:predicted Zn-dependent peptidase
MLVSSYVDGVIREEEGLSYAAYVPVIRSGATGAGIYLSTTRPDTAIKLVNRILEYLETDATIPRPILRRSARSFHNEYLFGMESASSHASMLASAQLYNGDYRIAAQRAEIMGRMGYSDMRRMIKNYVKNIQYAYVGDTTRLPRREMLKR